MKRKITIRQHFSISFTRKLRSRRKLFKLVLVFVTCILVYVPISSFLWREAIPESISAEPLDVHGLQGLPVHTDITILSTISSRIPEFPPTNTSMKDWTFTKKVKCPNLTFEVIDSPKISFSISCKSGEPHVTTRKSPSINVTSFSFGDQCLSDFIYKHCTDGHPVPNVLHYIWYGKVEVKFHHFLSFMSVVRFMRPCLILFHGNYLPYGKYWDYFTWTYHRLAHVVRPLVTKIHGKMLSFKEHGADVMRIEALQQYGGLYIDTDTVLLRSVDDLRKHNFTMGHEYQIALGNQFILARKGAPFLHLWHKEYKNYRFGHWDYNSLYVPFQIALKNPNLIHIEDDKFTRPNFRNLNLLFQNNFDWSINYAMHLYIRMYRNKTDEDVIRTLNTTLGSVSRHILFGNKELCL